MACSLNDKFSWGPITQGRILGAYSYGHVLSQVLGGFLEARFGGKKVLGLNMLLASVLTLLTPVAAFAGEWWLFVVRVLVGFGQGVVFPCTFGMLSRWAPPVERGRLLTIATLGAAGLAFCCLWYSLAFDSPSKHPRISEAERTYIESNLEDKNKNGGLSAVPYLTLMASRILASLIIDPVIKRSSFKKVNVRKASVLVLVGVAVCLVAVGQVGCDSTAAICLLCLGMAMRGVMIPGFYPSFTELTLGFSGVAFGVSNSVSNCTGFIVPLLVGILTDRNQTVEAWQNLFYIGAAISVSGSVMALLFLRTDPVSWAKDPDEDRPSMPARGKLISDMDGDEMKDVRPVFLYESMV
ncbi:SLC17A5 [Branchiostoma lanceolatum]|uniref:SLC17A5 protein n=1 Tax=Branchiostoma lanceolatum TaxID=7740 RepID=A0A8K0EF30_BRALA|nr:SLC17A5 [Branchiostoma lanceolatum]